MDTAGSPSKEPRVSGGAPNGALKTVSASPDKATDVAGGTAAREILLSHSHTMGFQGASLGSFEPSAVTSAPVGTNASGGFPAAGWINRVQNRTQELCRWFGIPLNEVGTS